MGHHGSHNATTDAFLEAITPEIAVIAMGVPTREFTHSAWGYGHPRKAIVDRLERHVSKSRTPITVHVATSMHEFETKRLRRAIFGTGWDGSIVLEADTAGNWRNVKQPLAPGPMVFADVVGTVNLSALVDINSAGVEELSRLPRIGFVRAKAIIAHRTEHGPFSSVDELENVKGIGPATAIAIREYVTVIAQ